MKKLFEGLAFAFSVSGACGGIFCQRMFEVALFYTSVAQAAGLSQTTLDSISPLSGDRQTVSGHFEHVANCKGHKVICAVKWGSNRRRATIIAVLPIRWTSRTGCAGR